VIDGDDLTSVAMALTQISDVLSRIFHIVTYRSESYTSPQGQPLKVRIHDGGVPIDNRLRAHVQRRLDYALSGFAGRVRDVVVRLSNDEPARSPRLNRCDINVSLLPRHVRVADTGASPFIAVANASDGLVRAVSRALAREQNWAAGGPPPPPPKNKRR